jgi:hypothetical protein
MPSRPCDEEIDAAGALAALADQSDSDDDQEQHDNCIDQGVDEISPPSRAEEWSHVRILSLNKKDPRWQCNYCGHCQTGSVSRIKAHLGQDSKNGVKICKEAPAWVSSHFMGLIEEKRQAKDLQQRQHALRRRVDDPGKLNVTVAPGSASGSSSLSQLKQPTTPFALTPTCPTEASASGGEAEEACNRSCGGSLFLYQWPGLQRDQL